MQKLTQIKSILSEAEGDAVKFYENNNNAAGTRIRQAMLEIKKLAQEMRLEITEHKNKEA
jgi:hypothetical protein